MQEELKSLKNPTRILTIAMFLAVFISAIGADGLAQLTGIPPIICFGVVNVCAYIVAQYGTEKRIVRAEELKDQEYQDETEDDEVVLLTDDELMDDGI